jgi:hypothetical protein
MPSRSLPSRPILVQLKRQANELRRTHREGKRAAAARIVAHHPRLNVAEAAHAAGIAALLEQHGGKRGKDL